MAGLKNKTSQFSSISTTKVGTNNLQSNVAPNMMTSGVNNLQSNFSPNKMTQGTNNVQSNFTGDFKLPESPGELAWTYDTTATDKRTDTFSGEALSTVQIYYPDSVKYSGHAGWNSSYDGKFVRGTGVIPDSPSEDTPLGFKFLKSINEKGNTHIFSITSAAKAILLANIGKDSFA